MQSLLRVRARAYRLEAGGPAQTGVRDAPESMQKQCAEEHYHYKQTWADHVREADQGRLAGRTDLGVQGRLSRESGSSESSCSSRASACPTCAGEVGVSELEEEEQPGLGSGSEAGLTARRTDFLLDSCISPAMMSSSSICAGRCSTSCYQRSGLSVGRSSCTHGVGLLVVEDAAGGGKRQKSAGVLEAWLGAERDPTDRSSSQTLPK